LRFTNRTSVEAAFSYQNSENGQEMASGRSVTSVYEAKCINLRWKQAWND